MTWLDGRDGDLVTQAALTEFEYDGHRLPLMDRQRGIRKPAGLDAALSTRTVYTEPGQMRPYAEAEGPDGPIRYKYRGDDPLHLENRALRRAYFDGLPLICFVGVAPGVKLQGLARFPGGNCRAFDRIWAVPQVGVRPRIFDMKIAVVRGAVLASKPPPIELYQSSIAIKYRPNHSGEANGQ